jgi:hypothetical protein
MPTDDQARADAESTTEMVEDPLDASNATDEVTNAYAEYDAEVDGLIDDDQDAQDDYVPQGEQPAGDEEPEPETADPEEDPAEEEEPAKPGRFRIRTDDPVEAEALEMRKRHPEWSLEDCLTKAKQVLGVSTERPAAQTEQPESESVASINEQIKALNAEKREKFAEMEFEAGIDIDSQIEELREKREALRINEAQQKARQEQEQISENERKIIESERRAVTYYPDTTDPNSSMVKLMTELDRRMQEIGDPLYDSPDKPFILAKQAARELGIPMTDPKRKPSPGTPSVRPVQPAPGNRRTSAPAPSARLDADLDKIETLEDYEALIGQ